ncbi:MAG: metal ABC transporter ATP-binding protein [Anaerolineaceae bacterium]|nr:metal ABC transporter ATP-binding protein [Anaerolineaceae bacterium]
MEPKEIIKIENLWAGYDDEPVIENVNFTIRAGDFIGLIGPNGGGKSTLIRCILGLITPFRGSIKIMGEPVESGRRYVGYVPQNVLFDRDFPISVIEVVLMGRLSQKGWLKHFNARDYAAAEKALRQVNMLHLKNRPISDLSGGQRQRIYIARALVAEPKILILDEPTSSVDANESENIYQLLAEMNDEVTILLISHDISVISAYTKTIGCLNRTLIYHENKELTGEMLEDTYHCPVDLIAHGVPHRVFGDHQH